MKKKRRTDYVERISSDQLQDALFSKLTAAELTELNRQIRNVCEDAVNRSVEATYKRFYVITLRILLDRFSFTREQIRALWDYSMSYIKDIEEGLISVSDVMATLEHEEDIKIEW